MVAMYDLLCNLSFVSVDVDLAYGENSAVARLWAWAKTSLAPDVSPSWRFVIATSSECCGAYMRIRQRILKGGA